MSNQQATNQQQKPMALTIAALNSVPNVRGILEIDAVQKNWVNTYNKMTGRHDGETRFEAEKILFLQATSGSGFKDVERFSLYSAFIELAISGLTLRDGLSYMVPYGKKVQFMPGWKGRLEQICEMPDVIYAHEPQVVREGDIFDFELGMSPMINRHRPIGTGEITHVYFVIDFTHGPKVYFMTAAEVLNIRDHHSQPYKSYLRDCKAAGKEVGEIFEKHYQSYSKTVEPPMWITDEVQAFKKTIVKRVYNNLPKLEKHKYLDSKITEAAAHGLEDEDADLNGEQDFDKYKGIAEGEMQDANVVTSGPLQQGAGGDNGSDNGETF